MVKIEDTDVSYRELLVIDADSNRHTCDCLGIRDDGVLLLIREKEVRSGNAYCLDRVFFRIDKEEYLQCLGIAAKNLRLQRAISKRAAVLEVSYRGRYFSPGTSVKYMAHHKECSVFTGDAALAEEFQFGRIDKFEYEKTIRIRDCDAVRITHKDAESEAVFLQMVFSPFCFEEWLDEILMEA